MMSVTLAGVVNILLIDKFKEKKQMKIKSKLTIILTFLLLSTFDVFTLSVPQRPDGSSFRVDRWSGTPMESTGTWQEMSHYKDAYGNSVWGQSQCYGSGTDCHLYDWFTWWMPELITEPALPPNPPGEGSFTSEYPANTPVGYNSSTGEYLY